MLNFIFIYILITIIICIIAKKIKKKKIIKSKNTKCIISAISTNTSDMGAWLFMGLPAAIYTGGIKYYWSVIGLIIFMYITWNIIGKKIKKEFIKYKVNNLPLYLEKKNKDKTKIIKYVTSIMTIFFLINYISAGICANGYLFEIAFKRKYTEGCLICVFITLIYILTGNKFSTNVINFFQGIYMLIITIIIAILTINYTELIIIKENIKALLIDYNVNKNNFKDIINLTIGWGIGYFGQPHIINKIALLKKTNEIKKAKIISAVWQFLILNSVSLIGISGVIILKNIENPHLIYLETAKKLLPENLYIIIIFLIISTIISSIDSQIITIYDIIKKNIIDKKKKKNKLLIIVAISIISLLLTINKKYFIFDLVEYCWTGLSCIFGPQLIMTLYYKKTNNLGIIISIIIGIIISVFYRYIKIYFSPIILGYIIEITIIFIFSNIKKKI